MRVGASAEWGVRTRWTGRKWWAWWRRCGAGKCRNMVAPLQGIPGVKVQLMDNIIGHQPYGVTLELDPAITGMTCQDVVDRLKAGDPPIWTRVREGDNWIILHAFGLNEGEDRVVGARIAALFGK